MVSPSKPSFFDIRSCSQKLLENKDRFPYTNAEQIALTRLQLQAVAGRDTSCMTSVCLKQPVE